jgi:ribosomal protein L7/L12
VDLLLKHAGLSYDPKTLALPEVLEALRRGDKIGAIKCYREATGVGLKEAKDFVEELQASSNA